MDFLNLASRASYLHNDSLFKKDPTLGTLRASLSFCKSINTVYENYIKSKKSCRQCFCFVFVFLFFCAIDLAWMQKLKHIMVYRDN